MWAISYGCSTIAFAVIRENLLIFAVIKKNVAATTLWETSICAQLQVHLGSTGLLWKCDSSLKGSITNVVKSGGSAQPQRSGKVPNNILSHTGHKKRKKFEAGL